MYNNATMYPPGRDLKRKTFSSPPKSIPTWSPNQCVALDAEMVGVGQYGEDSSVARVVIVAWDGKVLFDEYIKQTQAVTDYRTFISGIKPEHLASAKLSFRDARKQILNILYGRFLIGHGLKNDLKALGISHPWWLIRDVSLLDVVSQSQITPSRRTKSHIFNFRLPDMNHSCKLWTMTPHYGPES